MIVFPFHHITSNLYVLYYTRTNRKCQEDVKKYMVPFAERLQEARKHKHLTQKEVAAYLAMTERSYQHYEGNRRRPSYEVLVALADYFDVTTDYLLGRTDLPK